jgi:GNAT superfamily N-acetyltransferase
MFSVSESESVCLCACICITDTHSIDKQSKTAFCRKVIAVFVRNDSKYAEGKVMKIRLATINDCENLQGCLIKVWESLREWMPASFVDPELESMGKPAEIKKLQERIENKNEILLIAEENHQIVGMALGREMGAACSLGFLGVTRKSRSKGVGSKLLNRFIRESRKRKAHKIWLFTSPHLIPAIRLYVKNGFLPEGFLRQHTRGQDLIIYSKFL